MQLKECVDALEKLLLYLFDRSLDCVEGDLAGLAAIEKNLPVVGLCIVLLGGAVSATSQPGVGTTFRVEVPVRPAAALPNEETTIVVERGARTG